MPNDSFFQVLGKISSLRMFGSQKTPLMQRADDGLGENQRSGDASAALGMTLNLICHIERSEISPHNLLHNI